MPRRNQGDKIWLFSLLNNSSTVCLYSGPVFPLDLAFRVQEKGRNKKRSQNTDTEEENII